jgi:DNA invertase Pin-like site-specific DNA recombinase
MMERVKKSTKNRPETIDHREILTLLDDGVSMRKTAGKLGVSLFTVQRVKIENMTCFGAVDH